MYHVPTSPCIGILPLRQTVLDIHVRGQVAYINFLYLLRVGRSVDSFSRGMSWDVDVHGYYS